MKLKKLAITLMTTSLIMGINGIPAMAAENTVINENVTFENLNASSAVNTLRQKQWTVDKEAVYETVHHEAEGYYEEKKVVDQEAVYEEVLVSPEEGHWEQELVKDAWTETINHPEEFHYEQVKVVDQEAWDEPIYAYKVVCNFCNGDLTKLDANGRMNHVVNHFESGECTNIPGWSDTSEQVIIGYTHHDEVFHYEDKKVVDKEAWTETINHPAEYKDVWVVDKEAVYEQQLVSPEISHIEKVWVETKPAWDETVLVSPEEGHYEYVYLDPVAEFVNRLYVNLLQREADDSGLVSWTDVLKSGKEQGVKVAQGFNRQQRV